jgi:hypothetical protein
MSRSTRLFASLHTLASDIPCFLATWQSKGPAAIWLPNGCEGGWDPQLAASGWNAEFSTVAQA